MNAEELREVFSLFDKDGNGSISAKELQGVLRTLGQTPSDADILAMVQYMRDVYEWSMAGGRSGRFAVSTASQAQAAQAAPALDMSTAVVTLEMFSYLIAAKVKEVEVEEELKAALQVLEIHNRPGFLHVSALRSSVTSWGDRFTAEEVEELLKDADAAEDGVVATEDLVRSIMTR